MKYTNAQETIVPLESKPSPMSCYILFQITSGIFIFFWVVKMMRFVNQFPINRMYNIRVYVILLGSLFLIQTSALVPVILSFMKTGESGGFVKPLIITSIILLSLLISIFWSLFRDTKTLMGDPITISSVLYFITFSVLGFSISAVIQSRLNKLEVTYRLDNLGSTK